MTRVTLGARYKNTDACEHDRDSLNDEEHKQQVRDDLYDGLKEEVEAARPDAAGPRLASLQGSERGAGRGACVAGVAILRPLPIATGAPLMRQPKVARAGN
jgi:hypothetical protein